MATILVAFFFFEKKLENIRGGYNINKYLLTKKWGGINMSYVDGILVKDEVVLEKAKITKLYLVGAWIKGFFLCWLLFIPTIKAIKKTIVFRKMELALTNQRLVGRTGVVSREVMDVKLDKVSTVRIKESFWGRIFKFADIVVSTGGEDMEFLGIKNANVFKNKVMNAIEEYENYKINKQAQALAGAINK